jgi:hypothetical protein
METLEYLGRVRYEEVPMCVSHWRSLVNYLAEVCARAKNRPRAGIDRSVSPCVLDYLL